MSLRNPAIISAMIMTALTMTAAPAMAASHTTGKPNLTYQEVRGINKTYKGSFSGDWVRCNYVTKAKYVQTASCSKGKTVSESISGSAGFSASGISASIGFNVSYSTTVTAGNSVTIKPGGFGWFDVGFRYSRYTIGMEKRTCFTPGTCDPWSSPQTVTVQKHLGNTFHYFGTGAEK